MPPKVKTNREATVNSAFDAFLKNCMKLCPFENLEITDGKAQAGGKCTVS